MVAPTSDQKAPPNTPNAEIGKHMFQRGFNKRFQIDSEKRSCEYPLEIWERGLEAPKEYTPQPLRNTVLNPTKADNPQLKNL